MTNFKVLDLDYLPLAAELDRLFSDDLLKWNSHYQICINSPKDHVDNYLYGVASLDYDWEASYVDEKGVLHVPKRDPELKETDFTDICTVFKGTLFETAFNVIKKNYNVGRIRIMMSKPKTCLSWHTDATLRLHYPLKTSEGCFMVIEDEIKHLNKEQWVLANTLKYHTAFNGSGENRIHLVASILDNEF